MKTSQSVLIALLASSNATLSDEIDMELEIQNLIAQENELILEYQSITGISTELLTVKSCDVDPTNPSCTKTFCEKSSTNLKLAQCVKYQTCENTESKCTKAYCEKQREFLETKRSASVKNDPDLTKPAFCGQEWCMIKENVGKPQCKTCRYNESLCTYNWCNLNSINLGTRFCQNTYCSVEITKVQCIKPTCHNDELSCTYDWCHDSSANRKTKWCNKTYCDIKENYDKVQCHTSKEIMNNHLVIAREAYEKYKKLHDDKTDALRKCKSTNKIVIPKKGKVPKTVTDAIAKDCEKEVYAIKHIDILFDAANKKYTKESNAFKKKYGGDDAGLLFGISFGIVVCLGIKSCHSRQLKKEKAELQTFDHDDYVSFVDSEHA